jgi:aspartate/methionine/tyrosine aminotransferase
LNPLYETMATSVFERMSGLAAKHGAINLGQGFPDFGWPDEVLDAAARAVKEGSNQYPPSRGLPQLRDAVAAHYSRHHGLELDASHVCVTSGATEALGAAILASVSPGDEVIIFTPAYDCYAPMIRRAGGTVREVALEPPLWRIDRGAIDAVLSTRTRVLMLNNPHNPTGRLFDTDELEAVAAVAREHDLIVISDEVWEHILLDGQRFTPFATLPDMAGRTIKIGSAGKIFSLTGWKVGWMVAPPEMASVAARAHQFLTFATAPNLQAAVAFGLNEGDAWIEPMKQRFARARDRMSEGLRDAGYSVLNAASTYFLCVDLSASGVRADDEGFATAAVERAGVAVVPLSVFAEDDPPRHLVRLCFAKRDETIDAGVAAMAKAKEMLA